MEGKNEEQEVIKNLQKKHRKWTKATFVPCGVLRKFFFLSIGCRLMSLIVPQLLKCACRVCLDVVLWLCFLPMFSLFFRVAFSLQSYSSSALL